MAEILNTVSETAEKPKSSSQLVHEFCTVLPNILQQYWGLLWLEESALE